MRRRWRHWQRGLVAAVSACSVVCLSTGTAFADPVTPNATGYSAGANVGGGGLDLKSETTGALAPLLGWLIDPIVNGAVAPLEAALQSSVTGILDSALGGSSNYKTTNPADQSTPAPVGAFPGDMPGSMPSPCTSGSTSKPCYSAGSLSASGGGLLSLSTGAVRGYAQQVSTSSDATNSIFGRAQVTDVNLDVLGLDVVTAGVIDAKASCPNAGTSPPTSSVSATSVNVLGLVGLSIASSSSLFSVTVGSTTYPLQSLPTLTVGSAKVQRYGTAAVRVSVPISLTSILSILGISGTAVSTLIGLLPASASFTLAVTIGASDNTTDDDAAAWGLGVGVDLSGSISVGLGSGITEKLSIASGMSGSSWGNLVDLKLAYVTCKQGVVSTSGTQAIPPNNT